MDNELEIISFEMGTKLPAQIMDKKIKSLSASEQKRIKSYHRWEDQQPTLLAHLFIRGRLKEILNVGEHKYISFMRTEKGRPYLCPSFGWEGDFNMSHSGERILAGISKTGKIGVDIERINPIDMSITHHCFTSEEHYYYDQLSLDEAMMFFFRIWTLKEAFVKTIGQGLSYPLKQFGFNMNQWSKGQIELRASNTTYETYYFKSVQVNSDHFCISSSLIPSSSFPKSAQSFRKINCLS